MTSSDYLFSNDRDSRSSTALSLNLSVPSLNNATDSFQRNSSLMTTPRSTLPNYFSTRSLTSHAQINAFTCSNHPPSAPMLQRKNFQIKLPEQDILDKNFFHTFNINQSQNEKTINHNSEKTTNIGNYFLI